MQDRARRPRAGTGTGLLQVLLAGVAVVAALWLVRAGIVGERGLRADYGFVAADGLRHPVTTQRDRALWLPRPASFYPPYLRSWNEARDGFPAGRPRLDVEWTGFLEVKRAAPRAFAVLTSGDVTLQVGAVVVAASRGEERIASSPFARGMHPIRIHFREGSHPPMLQVSEVLEDGRRVPLASGLRPDATAPDADRRGMLPPALALACSLAAVVMLRRRRKGPRPGVLPGFALAILALLVLGLILRVEDRAAVPSYTETADEYYHAWAGWSLLHGREPVGWSWSPAYGPVGIRHFFGEPYPIVRPFLDHPPLSPVLAALGGSLAARFTGRPELSGSAPFDAPPLEALRTWPILCSGLALVLLMLLARRLFGAEPAVAAGLLYATTPLWVAQQRIVKEEAVLAPLLLAALLLVLRRSDDARGSLRELGKRDAVLLFAVAALCPLLKTTAAIVPLALAGIALPTLAGGGGARPEPARRIVLVLLAGTAVGALLLLAYAAALDWELFWRVQAWLASKPTGAASALGVLTQSTVAHLRPTGSGWTLWMWLAALPALSLHERRLAWTVLLYLLVIVSFANPKLLYGWYLLPVQPLLAIGAARLLLPASIYGSSSVEGTTGGGAELRLASCGLVLFLALYVGTSIQLLESATRFSFPARGLYAVSAVALIPFLWPMPSRRAWRIFVWTTLGLSCALNVWVALHLRFYY